MALLDKLFRVPEVANLLGLTDGRIRQICRALKLGVKDGRDRFLTPADIEVIREREKRKSGRPPKKSIGT